MSEPKVDVDVAYLRQLLKTAIRNDTLIQWAAVAMEWAEASEARINELTICGCGAPLSQPRCTGSCDNDE